MNKKILTPLILSIFLSLLLNFVISNYFAGKEASLQNAKAALGAEIVVPVGVPFPYRCIGLCHQETNIKNLLVDIAIYFIPLFILFYLILEILNPSWIRILTKLIIPFIIIAGYIAFESTQSSAMCDCFSNSYGTLTISMISLVFLVGSTLAAYLMEKKKKEWKIIYTIAVVVLFVITSYIAFSIGDHFYISTGF